MVFDRASYLYKITHQTQQFKSVAVNEKMDGTSPPSVFIGSFGYPKVFAGPMLTSQHGDTSQLDTPEQWLDNKQLVDIVNFRLKLVRGKSIVSIKDLDNKFVSQLQEIALSKKSADTEAEFANKPRGVTFNADHSPFGPSAQMKSLNVLNVRWSQQLEKFYYDKDIKAAEAVVNLYKNNVLVSQIQKAFSVGTMGFGQNRKLVPTRRSITAVDDILGKYLLTNVKEYPILDSYKVFEFSALKNKFIILLMPTPWQYEWMEAFIHILGKEEMIFSDWEPCEGKKGYSVVGGCFYSVKFGVLELLEQIKKQAGAIVFREAYPGYVPTGVWLCREETREALKQSPKDFNSLEDALNYISTKLFLPLERFRRVSKLLKTQQKRLTDF